MLFFPIHRCSWTRLSLSSPFINSHIYRNAINGGSHRYFSTKIPLSEQIVTPYPPLSQPLAGLPSVEYAKSTIGPRETRVTTLPNGLRVASESRFGQFCTIGGKPATKTDLVISPEYCERITPCHIVCFLSLFSVVIDSGPRYEVAFPSGVSHFLEKLAFHVSTRVSIVFCPKNYASCLFFSIRTSAVNARILR